MPISDLSESPYPGCRSGGHIHMEQDLTPTTTTTLEPGSNGRDDSAAGRDREAEHRDRSAEVRDRAADERDLEAQENDDLRTAASEAVRSLGRALERRDMPFGRRASDSHAAADRDRAAADRDEATASRLRGAADRTRASDGREAASADRDEAAKDRDVSSMDELTGAYRRGPGMVELEREMGRSKRTRHPFVIGFIDVDGLKARNDSLGHAAGDELLVGVVGALRDQFRSYDLIVRFGGDEFVCGIQDLGIEEIARRLTAVESDLGTRGASITVGLAELGEDDSLSHMIARADEELYEKRSLRPSTRA